MPRSPRFLPRLSDQTSQSALGFYVCGLLYIGFVSTVALQTIGVRGGGLLSPSQNEIGQIINVSRANIGGGDFKKETHAI